MTIELGNLEGLIERGPAELINPTAWSQEDSDTFAHLIQVQSQIQSSAWNAAKCEFTVQGEETLDAQMPDIESFVYAAVYFRQLIAEKDDLLTYAVQRHSKHADCQIRRSWVKHELDCFKSHLTAPAWPQIPNTTSPNSPPYTLKQVFDAFLYGAGLLHRFPSSGDKSRKRFLDIYDNNRQTYVLYSLNMGLRLLMNHIGRITVVIHQDDCYWHNKHSLPLTDVRWHDGLFEMRTSESD